MIALIGPFIDGLGRAPRDDRQGYTDGNAITIGPTASGYVLSLPNNDHVYVHKADLLLFMDKRDYYAQVDALQAEPERTNELRHLDGDIRWSSIKIYMVFQL